MEHSPGHEGFTLGAEGVSAMNAAAAAGAACTAPRARSVSRRTRASLPSNARVQRGAFVTLRANASDAPARSARRGELQRVPRAGDWTGIQGAGAL